MAGGLELDGLERPFQLKAFYDSMTLEDKYPSACDIYLVTLCYITFNNLQGTEVSFQSPQHQIHAGYSSQSERKVSYRSCKI